MKEATALVLGGFLDAGELCWLRDAAPPSVREFFQSGYPDAKSVPDNLAAISRAGAPRAFRASRA
jgi:hypothetical protein